MNGIDGTRRFRAEREPSWRALEDLLATATRGGLRRLTDEELTALPVLYRAALSSLSVARDTSLDRALTEYLEDLSTRAYLFVYGVRTPLGRRVLGFFTTDWPRAVRAIAWEVALAFSLVAAGWVVAYLLTASDIGWYSALIDTDIAGGRGPDASAADLRKTLSGADKGPMALFATYLFTNNAQVSFMAFALGFAFGVPTALLLVMNGAQGGALTAVFAAKGLALDLGGWLAIHGTTEIFAIAVAGGAGFHIGRALAFPGRDSRAAAATRAGRTAATAMLGATCMLVVAGVLEGIGRQLIADTGLRYAIGGVMLLLWLAYYTFAGRAPRRG